jgi:hypothetical protein
MMEFDDGWDGRGHESREVQEKIANNEQPSGKGKIGYRYSNDRIPGFFRVNWRIPGWYGGSSDAEKYPGKMGSMGMARQENRIKKTYTPLRGDPARGETKVSMWEMNDGRGGKAMLGLERRKRRVEGRLGGEFGGERAAVVAVAVAVGSHSTLAQARASSAEA